MLLEALPHKRKTPPAPPISYSENEPAARLSSISRREMEPCLVRLRNFLLANETGLRSNNIANAEGIDVTMIAGDRL